MFQSKKCNLWVHEDRFSKQEVILHPEVFPELQPGDLVEIVPASAIPMETRNSPKDSNDTHALSSSKSLINKESNEFNRLIIQISQVEPELIAKQPQLQVSLSAQIATLFELQPRKDVLITRIDSSSVSADYIELAFRDQYIGRGDMFRLKHFLLNTCVHVSKKLTFAGCIRAQIKEIYVNGASLSCGYITQNTKMIFRSESAKYFIFIQISAETFQFDTFGEMYYEKAVLGFLPELFSKWKQIGANHVVSIVLFSRVLYTKNEYETYSLFDDPCCLSDGPDNSYYKDFYKVVTDWETRADWNTVMPAVKKDTAIFMNSLLELQLKYDDEIKVFLAGRLSLARQGNVLEAVNLALNIFDKHYIDRDLLRTGLSVVVISASNGMFETTKDFLRLSSERMIEDGIGLDLVCLNRPPLFTVPLFRFKAKKENVSNLSIDSLSASVGKTKEKKPRILESIDPLYENVEAENNLIDNEWLYNIPHWVDMSFYDSYLFHDKLRLTRFLPRIAPLLITTSKKCDLIVGVKDLDPNITPDQYDQIDKSNSNTQLDKQVFQTPLKPSSLLSQRISSQFPDVYREENLMSKHPDSYSPPKFNVDGLAPRYSSQTELSSLYNPKGPIYIEQSSNDSSVSPKPIISPSQQSSNPIYINNSKIEKYADLIKGSIRYGHSLGRSPSKKNLTESPKKEKTLAIHSSNSTLANISKNQIIDPCCPGQNLVKTSSHLRRWHHIFPQLLKKNTSSLVKWTSLCTPACLPLTTDYFPSSDELTESYQEYAYTVSLNDDFSDTRVIETGQSHKRTEKLLLELIAQRLVQGFQLVIETQHTSEKLGNATILNIRNTSKSGTSPGTQAFPFPVTSPTATRYLDSRTMIQASPYAPIYLSMGQQIHRLAYDPAGQNVEVRRYVRKTDYAANKQNYACAMWTKDGRFYKTKTTMFSFPESSDYNWNYLDHVVSGYQDELTESLRFWRTRFILIPLETVPNSPLFNPQNETLTDEEVRLAGFLKFVEVFHRARWTQYSERGEMGKENAISSRNVPITFTTFNTSTYVENELKAYSIIGEENLNEALHSRRVSSADHLTKEAKPSIIAGAIQNPSYGVAIKDRRWHLRFYEKAFIGSECVDWFVKMFTDIYSREEAVEFGNNLMEKGVFEHVNRKHRFLDGHYFYKITKDYMPKEQKEEKLPAAIRWFRNNPKNDETEDTPSRPAFQKVELSRKIVIDLDQQGKSYRKELAVLHYDSVHNAKNCYHFHLHWLVCTARLVEDLLQSWARFAEKCGLKLVEAPVEQAKLEGEDDNPFQSPIEIFLSVPPPEVDLQNMIIPESYFETELVKHFGFILDVESDDKIRRENVFFSFSRQKYKYTQFVHRTGTAFIQIREKKRGFLWVINRLLASHSQSVSSNKTVINMADSYRKDFETFCSDEQQLKQFWESVLNQLNPATLMEEVTDDNFLREESRKP